MRRTFCSGSWVSGTGYRTGTEPTAPPTKSLPAVLAIHTPKAEEPARWRRCENSKLPLLAKMQGEERCEPQTRCRAKAHSPLHFLEITESKTSMISWWAGSESNTRHKDFQFHSGPSARVRNTRAANLFRIHRSAVVRLFPIRPAPWLSIWLSKSRRGYLGPGVFREVSRGTSYSKAALRFNESLSSRNPVAFPAFRG